MYRSSETLKLKLLSCENLQGIDKDIAVVVYLIALLLASIVIISYDALNCLIVLERGIEE